MTIFDDREDAFEKQFVLDQELQFRATARRNKRFGLWVAERLGRSAPEAEAYAKQIVMADFREARDGDVMRTVMADLEAAGRSVGAAELKAKLNELMAQAVDDIKAGR